MKMQRSPYVFVEYERVFLSKVHDISCLKLRQVPHNVPWPLCRSAIASKCLELKIILSCTSPTSSNPRVVANLKDKQ